MKKKNLFMTLGLALTLGAGVAAGLSVNKTAVEAKAEAAATDVIQYFDASAASDWKDGGAITKVWVTGSSSLADTWVPATNISGFLYKFTLPATYTTYTIARLNPETQDWGWGQFHDVTYSADYNFIKSTGWSEGKMAYSRGWLKQMHTGDKIYLTVYASDYNWFDGNPISRIGFYDGTSVDGVVLSGSSTLEFTLTSDVLTDGFNVFRLNPLNEQKWNQTDDFRWTSATNSYNAFVAETNNHEWEHYLGSYSQELSDDYLGVAYSIHFLNATKSICSTTSESADHSEALTTAWTGLKTAYNGLLSDKDKKDVFKDSSDAFVANARNRYAHIIGRYNSLEQFASGVNPEERANFVSVLNAESTNNNVALIIVTVSVITLAAVGGYFLLRRKEN